MNKAKELLRTIGSALIAVGFFFLLFAGMSFAAIPAAVLSLGMYFGAYILLKPRTKIGRIEVDDIKDGIGSLKLMEEAEQDIRTMEKFLPQVRSRTAADDIEGLITTGRKILNYLTEHPDKISGAHRFADYYLDMAAKLVENYVDLQKAEMTEGSVSDVMNKTQDALKALNTAFQKQLVHLMEGELMEVESDIKVLGETLKMEGDI